jgi:hypothetical protein
VTANTGPFKVSSSQIWKTSVDKQEGHDGPESLTRNNCFSVLEIIHRQYFLISNLSIEYVKTIIWKMLWPGAFKLSLNRANQINMSKLDTRLPKNATKFGDHLSIILVGNDVQMFFNFML